jgi:hypothetical protein
MKSLGMDCKAHSYHQISQLVVSHSSRILAPKPTEFVQWARNARYDIFQFHSDEIEKKSSAAARLPHLPCFAYVEKIA